MYLRCLSDLVGDAVGRYHYFHQLALPIPDVETFEGEKEEEKEEELGLLVSMITDALTAYTAVQLQSSCLKLQTQSK